mmetsp:Transcript_168129/g.540018  ORF Transcript_168129/g.540018 Transcript_168129/m.540018 type:complete len:227 (-) Transcript_168129:124-804(-)
MAWRSASRAQRISRSASSSRAKPSRPMAAALREGAVGERPRDGGACWRMLSGAAAIAAALRAPRETWQPRTAALSSAISRLRISRSSLTAPSRLSRRIATTSAWTLLPIPCCVTNSCIIDWPCSASAADCEARSAASSSLTCCTAACHPESGKLLSSPARKAVEPAEDKSDSLCAADSWRCDKWCCSCCWDCWWESCSVCCCCCCCWCCCCCCSSCCCWASCSSCC